MSITPEQLAEWRKLAEAATPGPWVNCPEQFKPDGATVIARMCGQDVVTAGPVDYPKWTDGEYYDPFQDPPFVAAARTGWPAAMDALEAVTAERDKLKAELGEWVRAFNLAFRGTPQSEKEREVNEKEGFLRLWDLAHGRGWVHQPPCALEAMVRENDRLAARVAELESASTGRNWLVWSNEHRAWWGPNRSGYYADIASAGRYTLSEARECCRDRSQRAGENPTELIQPSPEWLATLEDRQ